MDNRQDLYTDYHLLSCFGQVTSTKLSSVLNESVSPERFTGHPLGWDYGTKELRLSINDSVNKFSKDEACSSYRIFM